MQGHRPPWAKKTKPGPPKKRAGPVFCRKGRGLVQKKTCQQVPHAAYGHAKQPVGQLCNGVLDVIYLRHARGKHRHITVKAHMCAKRGAMTKLYDKNKIPRAMLSYITDAQASPLNALIPIGTWGIFYQSVFVGYAEVTALGDSMSVYNSTVPFIFYGWVSVAIALLVALGVLKPMGAMKKAYERAQATGRLYSEESDALNTDDGEEAPLDSVKTKKLLAGFIIPLAVFIVIVLVNGDVVLGSLVTIAVAFVLFLALRLARWNELMKACMQGITDMVPMIVIVFAAYMVRDSLIAIGMPEYVISIAQPFMSPALLPVITFVICALLAFMSGTNWGSTLPVAAVVIPLCASVGGNMPMVLSAVISGAAFGAHACFYCDVTIFTSGMTKIDNMEHATTQIP